MPPPPIPGSGSKPPPNAPSSPMPGTPRGPPAGPPSAAASSTVPPTGPPRGPPSAAALSASKSAMMRPPGPTTEAPNTPRGPPQGPPGTPKAPPPGPPSTPSSPSVAPKAMPSALKGSNLNSPLVTSHSVVFDTSFSGPVTAPPSSSPSAATAPKMAPPAPKGPPSAPINNLLDSTSKGQLGSSTSQSPSSPLGAPAPPPSASPTKAPTTFPQTVAPQQSNPSFSHPANNMSGVYSNASLTSNYLPPITFSITLRGGEAARLDSNRRDPTTEARFLQQDLATNVQHPNVGECSAEISSLEVTSLVVEGTVKVSGSELRTRREVSTALTTYLTTGCPFGSALGKIDAASSGGTGSSYTAFNSLVPSTLYVNDVSVKIGLVQQNTQHHQQQPARSRSASAMDSHPNTFQSAPPPPSPSVVSDDISRRSAQSAKPKEQQQVAATTNRGRWQDAEQQTSNDGSRVQSRSQSRLPIGHNESLYGSGGSTASRPTIANPGPTTFNPYLEARQPTRSVQYSQFTDGEGRPIERSARTPTAGSTSIYGDDTYSSKTGSRSNGYGGERRYPSPSSSIRSTRTLDRHSSSNTRYAPQHISAYNAALAQAFEPQPDPRSSAEHHHQYHYNEIANDSFDDPSDFGSYQQHATYASEQHPACVNNYLSRRMRSVEAPRYQGGGMPESEQPIYAVQPQPIYSSGYPSHHAYQPVPQPYHRAPPAPQHEYYEAPQYHQPQLAYQHSSPTVSHYRTTPNNASAGVFQTPQQYPSTQSNRVAAPQPARFLTPTRSDGSRYSGLNQDHHTANNSGGYSRYPAQPSGYNTSASSSFVMHRTRGEMF